jgi:hypothetical protein
MGDIEEGYTCPGFGEEQRRRVNYVRESPAFMVYLRTWVLSAVVAYQYHELESNYLVLPFVLNLLLLCYSCSVNNKVHKLVGIVIISMDTYLSIYLNVYFIALLIPDCLFVRSVYKIEREG